MQESARKQQVERLLQLRRIRIIEEPEADPFVCVYSQEDVKDGFHSFCYLLPPQQAAPFLQDLGWSKRPDDFTPHVQSMEHWPNGKRVHEVKYLRDGNDTGAQALVRVRHFWGSKPPEIEVAEEFRLFHNLYHDKGNNVFIHCDTNGTEHEVVRACDERVEVQLRFLTSFLRAKQMHLGMQWDGGCWCSYPLEEIGLKPLTKEHHGAQFHWELCVFDSPMPDECKCNSRLIGKAVIPCPGPVRYDNPFDEDEKAYPSFIVGQDKSGSPLMHTCQPKAVKETSGLMLKPIFFRRGVLGKYFAEPAKYSVEDGRLSCGGLWDLSMDNDHPKYVVVFLKHLGECLPAPELDHWRAFNVPPDGRVSDTFYSRNIRAQFADPKMPDLRLKQLYRRANSVWQKAHGWPLWREPAKEDCYIFRQAHVCLDENQAEFDQQNGLLAKLLNDFLFEEKIKAALRVQPANPGGLNLLQQFLTEAGHPDADKRIKPLRLIQELRSKGSAHRKSKDYWNSLKQAGLDRLPLIQTSMKVFAGAVTFLEWILSDVLKMT
jgi:hypothetical protein